MCARMCAWVNRHRLCSAVYHSHWYWTVTQLPKELHFVAKSIYRYCLQLQKTHLVLLMTESLLSQCGNCVILVFTSFKPPVSRRRAGPGIVQMDMAHLIGLETYLGVFSGLLSSRAGIGDLVASATAQDVSECTQHLRLPAHISSLQPFMHLLCFAILFPPQTIILKA